MLTGCIIAVVAWVVLCAVIAYCAFALSSKISREEEARYEQWKLQNKQ